ncbi:MAG: hypothetical protein HQL05_03495 [Nitrospirae bacterium]|uniref:hypothetical protein n=1 Tax=Candidatus Magnetobacterium casense TaxID=1455061 RepID=UPI0012DF2110|nr:hypothetical protein [Candidatus Magnetobacterium casensis]MBF0336873.1 hypothetical protein [Nitrospirota bacterium]
MEDNEYKEQLGKVIGASVDSLYFNGFETFMTVGDVGIILKLQGKDILTLNTTFTVAKTLAENLTKIIQHLESKTETNILTMEDIGNAVFKQTVEG